MAVDLDKKRAERREAQGEGPKVVFGGITYELSPEVPYDVLEAFRGLALGGEHTPAALADIARALLGKHYEAFRSTDPPPSLDDLNELIGGVMEEYGVEAPLESSGS